MQLRKLLLFCDLFGVYIPKRRWYSMESNVIGIRVTYKPDALPITLLISQPTKHALFHCKYIIDSIIHKMKKF